MMDQLPTILGPVKILSVEEILGSVLLAFVLSSAVSAVYRWTYQGLSYSRSFVHTVVLGSVISCALIMAIGNNLARGLGIMGTLAIIRFRTHIRDPRDIIFLFAGLAAGIAAGAGAVAVGVLGTICFCLAAMYLDWSPFASRREYEGLLRFVIPSGFTQGERIGAVMKECCAGYEMIAMREAAQGDALEYSYHVRLVDPTYQTDLLNALKGIEGISEINLLMQRSTVEL